MTTRIPPASRIPNPRQLSRDRRCRLAPLAAPMRPRPRAIGGRTRVEPRSASPVPADGDALYCVPGGSPMSLDQHAAETTGCTACGTRPRTSWRRRCWRCSPRRSSPSARRSTTASTTTSSCRAPLTPEDLPEIEERMRSAHVVRRAVRAQRDVAGRGAEAVRRSAVQGRADRGHRRREGLALQAGRRSSTSARGRTSNARRRCRPSS